VTRQKLNARDIEVLNLADNYVVKLASTKKTSLGFADSIWRSLWEDYAAMVENYLLAYKPTKKPKKGKGK
jgi:hypothetical protein